MSIIEHLNRLDALIVEHTKPPVTPILRRELQIIAQELEAYQASSDKQDETLSTQAETIDRLVKENKEKDARLAKHEAQKFAPVSMIQPPQDEQPLPGVHIG